MKEYRALFVRMPPEVAGGVSANTVPQPGWPLQIDRPPPTVAPHNAPLDAANRGPVGCEPSLPPVKVYRMLSFHRPPGLVGGDSEKAVPQPIELRQAEPGAPP